MNELTINADELEVLRHGAAIAAKWWRRIMQGQIPSDILNPMPERIEKLRSEAGANHARWRELHDLFQAWRDRHTPPSKAVVKISIEQVE